MIRLQFILSVYKARNDRPSPWDLLERIERHETLEDALAAVRSDRERIGAETPLKIRPRTDLVLIRETIHGWTWTWDIQPTTVNN